MEQRRQQGDPERRPQPPFAPERQHVERRAPARARPGPRDRAGRSSAYCLIVPKVTPRSRCLRDQHREQHDRRHEDHHPRRDLRPRHAVDVSLQAGEVDRHRLGFVVVERHREAELVPRRDQAEHRRHGHAGRRLRHDDAHEGGQARVAVDQRRLFERARDLVDEALHQPDGEREIEARVEEDEPDVGVLEREAPVHDQDRHHDREGRQEPRRQDEEQPILRPGDPKPRKSVGAERRQADGRERRQDADDDAVPEVVVEIAGRSGHRLRQAAVGVQAGRELDRFLRRAPAASSRARTSRGC